jgi:Tfp pilus assembly protein PilF
MNVKRELYALSNLGRQTLSDGWLYGQCPALPGEWLIQLGCCQLEAKQARAALATLSRAVDLDRWNPFSWGLRACALSALGDEAAAMRSHRIGLELEDWRKDVARN